MSDRFVYLHHPSSLEHDTGTHPERAARIEAIEARLAGEDWQGWQPQQARRASRDQVERVHPPGHFEAIEAISRDGGGMIDADTVVSAGSFEAAMHAAGAAVEMADLLCDGEATAVFCGARPPGHHAEVARAMGFCLFNNVAVAAAHARAVHGVERVAILDWDVHHGNGTNDIFYTSDDVLYVSIHQSPLYPGSGSLLDSGGAAGEGYTINLPVPPGAGEPLYASLIEDLIAPVLRSYEPGLILVSTGYDAHRDDPLADCMLEDGSYGRMSAAMAALAAELGAGLGFVLEGGYDLRALSESVAATLRETRQPQRITTKGPRASEVAAARKHYARWWPALA